MKKPKPKRKPKPSEADKLLERWLEYCREHMCFAAGETDCRCPRCALPNDTSAYLARRKGGGR